MVRARRYRNRKLGDFLKELDLTEGKATGIPTILKEMKANGSPAALFETDEARTFFIATFPIHPYFSSIEDQNDVQNDDKNDAPNDAQNDVLNDSQNDAQTLIVSVRQNDLLKLIKANKKITRAELSEKLSISKKTVERDIKYLKEQGILSYKGSARTGEWIISKNRSIKVK